MKILIKSWEEAKDPAFGVREEVFIREQGVPAEMELDELDPIAIHALAYQDGMCIGTARIVKLDNSQSQIGRMAVLAPFRKQGVGSLILAKLTEAAKSQGASSIILHAQIDAIPFYEKLGFQVEGTSYIEAGIPHRNMILVLAN